MEKKYLHGSLEGEMVTLKKYNLSPAGKMFDYICKNRNRLSRFLPWPQHVKSVEDEIKFIEESFNAWNNNTGASYSLFRKSDEIYLGTVGGFNFYWINESCEIGYWILGQFEGNGYMQDAVKSLEHERFLVGFNRIVIMCEEENYKSKSIPLNLGYICEGQLRELKKDNDKHVSLEVYSKLKREYQPR